MGYLKVRKFLCNFVTELFSGIRYGAAVFWSRHLILLRR